MLVGSREERGNSVLLSHNSGLYVFDLFLKSGLEVREKGLGPFTLLELLFPLFL